MRLTIYLITLMSCILAVLKYVGTSASIHLFVSVDGSTASCSEIKTHTLIQNVKSLTGALLTGGTCKNVTKNSSKHCEGDKRSPNLIKVLEFGIDNEGFSCTTFLRIKDRLTNGSIDRYNNKRGSHHKIQDPAGFICGLPLCPSVLPGCHKCTRQPQQSKSQDPGVNAAAIGGGVGGALALLGLIIAAAALYRHFKRKSSVDDLSNAASQTGAAGATGVTPVVKIEDAPNSIPPAGTN